ncbi:hypothetical protein HYV79_05255 [Candidatus Woesearchaeota archaeon]|nr:hypothetical protein [Candidatus Woesearchaeota archaeon]
MLTYLKSEFPKYFKKNKTKEFIPDNKHVNFAITYHFSLRTLILDGLIKDQVNISKNDKENNFLTNLMHLRGNTQALEDMIIDEVICAYPPEIQFLFEEMRNDLKEKNPIHKNKLKETIISVKKTLMSHPAVLDFGFFRGEVFQRFSKNHSEPLRELYELSYCEAIEEIGGLKPYEKMIINFFLGTSNSVKDLLLNSGFVIARDFYSTANEEFNHTLRIIYKHETEWFKTLFNESC